MQFLASALRQVPDQAPHGAPNQAATRFADAAAAGSNAWPASDAHVHAARRLDACLEDLRARSSHGALLVCVWTGPCDMMVQLRAILQCCAICAAGCLPA